VLLRQFVLFGIVGCLGFLVDSGALYVLVRLIGLGALEGRLLSYLAAATVTWFLNRRVTFAAARTDSAGREWARFVLLNVFGGAVNYAVYAAYVTVHGATARSLFVGVAAGSLAGMTVNFLVSRRFVFNKLPQSPSAREHP
jgi:putative flippase GtrA